MPLVDYDSSDDSSDIEISQIEDNKPRGKVGPDVLKLVSNREDTSGNLFSALPKPKTRHYENDDNKLSDIFQLCAKNRDENKPTVKITIPSLLDYKNVDLPRRQPKQPQPAKGSGLFSLLPPPKNAPGRKNSSLVPTSVMKVKQEKVDNNKFNNVSMDINSYMSDSEEEDIEEEDASDDDEDPEAFKRNFFKIGGSGPDPLLTDEVFKSEPPEEREVINLVDDDDDDDLEIIDESSGNKTADNVLVRTHNIPITPENIPVTSEKIPVKTENLELNDEAMKILCGGSRKRKNVAIDLIDLSSEEIMPDPREWKVKQLTEEKKQFTTNNPKKSGGPSTMSKRKHQITYLAHQAKEQEQELQNQWAQNRLTRKQTQSKYGF